MVGSLFSKSSFFLTNKKKFIIIAGIFILLYIGISLPILAIFIQSPYVRYVVYQNILATKLSTPKAVFIGDSVTLGGLNWGFRLGHYNFSVWNIAQNGFTTEQIQVLAKDAASHRPKYVFVMAGINDSGKSDQVEEVFSHYKKIISIIREGGAYPIIQSTIYPENRPMEAAFVTELNRKLSAYAKEQQIPFLDLNKHMAPNKSLIKEYSRDGVHLTAAGYEVWTAALKAFIKENNLQI